MDVAGQGGTGLDDVTTAASRCSLGVIRMNISFHGYVPFFSIPPPDLVPSTVQQLMYLAVSARQTMLADKNKTAHTTRKLRRRKHLPINSTIISAIPD